MKKQKKKSSFTLIELLAAICIVSMILVASLPAFSKIASGKKMAYAVGTVSGQIKEARMYAITHNVYTAVVMPFVYEEGAYYAFSEKQRNSLMRGAVVYKDGGNFHFCYWIPDSDWKTLDNVIITDVSLKGNEKSNSKNNETPNTSDGLEKLYAKKIIMFTTLPTGDHAATYNAANVQTIQMRSEPIVYSDTSSSGDYDIIYSNQMSTTSGAYSPKTNQINTSSGTKTLKVHERAIIFDPNGRLVTTPIGKHVTVKLCEGTYDPDGNRIMSEADEIFLDVIPYSGQVIERSAN